MWNQPPSFDENIPAMDQLTQQIPDFEIYSGFIEQNNEKFVRLDEWNKMKAAYLNLMDEHFKLEDSFANLEDIGRLKSRIIEDFKQFTKQLKKERDLGHSHEEYLKLQMELDLKEIEIAEKDKVIQEIKRNMENMAIKNGILDKEKKALKISMEKIRKRPPKNENSLAHLRVWPRNEQNFGTKKAVNNNANRYQNKVNSGWIHPKNHRQNVRQGNIRYPENYNRLRTIEHFEGRNGFKNFGIERNGSIGLKNVGMKAHWKKKGRFRNGIDPEVEKWFEKRMDNWEKRKSMDNDLRKSLGINSENLHFEGPIEMGLKENCVNDNGKAVENDKIGWNCGKWNEKGLETDRSDRPMSNAKGANASADCENELGSFEGMDYGTEESFRMEGKNEENLEEDEQFFEKFFGHEFGGRSVAHLCDRPVSNANFPRLLTIVDGAFDLFDHRYLSETS